jgi:hypothetical protein
MMKSPTVSDITLSLKTIEATTVEGCVAGPSRRSSYACFACRKSRSAVLQTVIVKDECPVSGRGTTGLLSDGNRQVEAEVGEYDGACIKHLSPIRRRPRRRFRSKAIDFSRTVRVAPAMTVYPRQAAFRHGNVIDTRKG